MGKEILCTGFEDLLGGFAWGHVERDQEVEPKCAPSPLGGSYGRSDHRVLPGPEVEEAEPR